jgi:hypothetical protein
MGGREGLEPGTVVGGHTHNFDHTSIFFGGRWRVKSKRCLGTTFGVAAEG